MTLIHKKEENPNPKLHCMAVSSTELRDAMSALFLRKSFYYPSLSEQIGKI